MRQGAQPWCRASLKVGVWSAFVISLRHLRGAALWTAVRSFLEENRQDALCRVLGRTQRSPPQWGSPGEGRFGVARELRVRRSAARGQQAAEDAPPGTGDQVQPFTWASM